MGCFSKIFSYRQYIYHIRPLNQCTPFLLWKKLANGSNPIGTLTYVEVPKNGIPRTHERPRYGEEVSVRGTNRHGYTALAIFTVSSIPAQR